MWVSVKVQNQILKEEKNKRLNKRSCVIVWFTFTLVIVKDKLRKTQKSNGYFFLKYNWHIRINCN